MIIVPNANTRKRETSHTNAAISFCVADLLCGRDAVLFFTVVTAYLS